MKTTLLKALTLIMFFAWFADSKAQNDLPPPTANIQSIPAGSWVIAMDNVYGVSSSVGVMNIKAYGLAVELLWNNIPLKWIIRTGKAKDMPDMTVSVRSRFPTITTINVIDSFKAGPLVIAPSDTAAAKTVINAFNAKIATVANKVKIYRTMVAVNVDVRYTLTHKPFVAIYDDGGNAGIHEDYLINSMVDTSHYRILNPGTAIDSSSCYTIASTPHWGTGSSYSSADTLRLTNLKSFLLSGGNFLAECEGIDAVENFAPVRFMTTNGVTTINTSVSTQLYGNVDMPIMQFHGAFSQGGGSLYNYAVNRITSDFKNSEYPGLFFMKDVFRANGTTGTDGVLDTVVQVNACKISAPGTFGGNIIYLGGHSYNGTSSLADVNGERIYLNAMLIPARRIIADGILPTPYSFCQGDTIKINFTPPSTGFGYQWSGPNGYSSTTEDPVISNAQTVKAGVYSALIRTAEGCNYTYTTTVSVPLKPVFTAATTSSMLCEGDSCTISVSPTAGLSSVNWYLKDTTKSGCKPIGSSLYTSYSQLIKPTVSGTYVAIAFNASGCKDTSCVTVTVDKLPVLTSPFPTGSPLCYGRGSYASITPGYGGTGCTETYQYRIDGGAWTAYTAGTRIGTGAHDSVEIRAQRSCASGCVNKTVRLKWNVTAPQVVSGTGTLLPCVNSVAGYIGTLSAANPSPSTGVWSIVSGPGSIDSPTSLNTTVGSLSTTGVATVIRWVVTNSNGCKDTVQTTFTPPVMDPTLVSKYSNEYCLTCPVQDGNTFSYYDLNGKLLATVTDIVDATSIGNTTFCGQLPYNVAGNPAASDVQTVTAWIEGAGYVPQPYLPRAWNFNTTNDAPMTVNLYFTDGELAALTGKTIQDGGYFDFGGDAERLLLVAYPNNSDTFIPAGSPNGIVYHPVFTRVGGYWQVTFNIAQSATLYLYPTYWAAGYSLPVELTRFTATAVPEDVMIKLEWETASEINNAKFEIERAYDTKNFMKIGEVKGAGNTHGTTAYSFDDKEIVPGQLYYYRLRQLDFDGKHTYSKIVSAIIEAENIFSVSEFLPNPTSDFSIVKITTTNATKMEVAIYRIDGSLVKSDKYDLSKGQCELNIDVGNLEKGIYLVQFASKEGKWIRKLMRMK